jgi:hypothetical protein
MEAIHLFDRPPACPEDFLSLRRKSTDDDKIIDDDDPILFLVEHLFGQAHGLRNWKASKSYKGISELLTVSDEAFVLLSIENTWDAIQQEIADTADQEEGSNKSLYGKGKYTHSGTNIKFGGWTRAGIARFNELHEIVEENRNEPWATEVEVEITKKLMVRHKNLRASSVNSRRKIRSGDDQQEALLGREPPIMAKSTLEHYGLPVPTQRVSV